MHNIIFYSIIVILLANYFLELAMKYLNAKRKTDTLPTELQDVYSQTELVKSNNYQKANAKFSFWFSTYGIIAMMLMLYFEGFAKLDTLLKNTFENQAIISICFIGILVIASTLLNLPFEIYDTFVIEQKFGFNTTTPFLYLKDKIISLILLTIVGGLILYLILWFYTLTATMFWLYAWGLVTAFSVFMMLFYSNLIVPLFNKQTPLPEGELRTAIEEFCQKVDYKLDNIYQIDGSKRSTKANAYFTGLGKKKRIVLYDTLINSLTTNEIVAVLAHEIGHYKHKHTLQGLIASVLQTGIVLYIFSIFVQSKELSMALGVAEHTFHVNLIAFAIIYTPFSLIISIFENLWSRHNEYQADTYAAKNFNKQHIIASLKKLSVKNLSNLLPHPIYIFIYYSHPTLLQRIRNLSNN